MRRVGAVMLRRVILAGLSACLLTLTFGFSQGAFAQSNCNCWRNSKTGKAVPDAPVTSYTAGKAADVDISDRNRAFSPSTGDNFHRVVPCPPQTTTTTPPPVTTTPAPAGVGMLIVEPKVSFGLGGSSSSPSYASTGAQAPFSGDSSKTSGQFSGGVSIFPGLGIGPVALGFDFSVSTQQGQTLFSIPRHASGLVTLDANSSVVIDLLLKGEVPVGPSNNFFLSAGIGPSFRKSDITLTSNQSAFGGGIPTVSQSKSQTGLALSAGLSTFACPNCIAGNPLRVGVEGRTRFFTSQSISLTSPVFGFTETGSTGRTTDYSFLVTLGVPITIR